MSKKQNEKKKSSLTSEEAQSVSSEEDVLSDLSESVSEITVKTKSGQSECRTKIDLKFLAKPFVGDLKGNSLLVQHKDKHDASKKYYVARGVSKELANSAIHIHTEGGGKCNFMGHGGWTPTDQFNLSTIVSAWNQLSVRIKRDATIVNWFPILINAFRTIDENIERRRHPFRDSQDVYNKWGYSFQRYQDEASLELTEMFLHTDLDKGKREIFALMQDEIIKPFFIIKSGHKAECHTSSFAPTDTPANRWTFYSQGGVFLPSERDLLSENTQQLTLIMDNLLEKIDQICDLFFDMSDGDRPFSTRYRDKSGNLNPFSQKGRLAALIRSRLKDRITNHHFSFVFTLYILLNHLKRFAEETIGRKIEENGVGNDKRKKTLDVIKAKKAVARKTESSGEAATEDEEESISPLLRAFAVEPNLLEDERRVLNIKKLEDATMADLRVWCQRLNIHQVPPRESDRIEAIKEKFYANPSLAKSAIPDDIETYGLAIAEQILATSQPESSYFNIMRTLLSNLVDTVNVFLEHVQIMDGIPHTKPKEGSKGINFILFMNSAKGLCDYNKFKKAFTLSLLSASNKQTLCREMQKEIGIKTGCCGAEEMCLETLIEKLKQCCAQKGNCDKTANFLSFYLHELIKLQRIVTPETRQNVEEEGNIWLCMHLESESLESAKNHFKMLMENIIYQYESSFSRLGGGNNQTKSLTNKKNIKKVSKKKNNRRLLLQNRNIYKSKNRYIIKNNLSKRK